jgi:hypothetical protein
LQEDLGGLLLLLYFPCFFDNTGCKDVGSMSSGVGATGVPGKGRAVFGWKEDAEFAMSSLGVVLDVMAVGYQETSGCQANDLFVLPIAN